MKSNKIMPRMLEKEITIMDIPPKRNIIKLKKNSPPQPRRVRAGPIPFLDDPYRGPALKLSKEEIHPIGKNGDLSTRLVDYLLQRSLPSTLPNDVIVGSSNCMSYLQHYMQNDFEKIELHLKCKVLTSTMPWVPSNSLELTATNHISLS